MFLSVKINVKDLEDAISRRSRWDASMWLSLSTSCSVSFTVRMTQNFENRCLTFYIPYTCYEFEVEVKIKNKYYSALF